MVTHCEVLEEREEEAGENEAPEAFQAYSQRGGDAVVLDILLLHHILQRRKHLHTAADR